MAWSGPTTLATGTDKVAASSKTLTGINSSVGDMIVVGGVMLSGGNGLTGMTIADSSTNTWTLNNVNTTGRQDFIASCVVATGKTHSGGTITLTRTGTTNITAYAAEAVSFTGGLASSYEDTGVRANASGSSLSPSVTSNAASVAGDLFVAVFGDSYSTTIPAYTEASGWSTAVSVLTTAAAAAGSVLAYQVNAGTSALTHNPTLVGGGVQSWKEMVTGFFVASSGTSVALTGVAGTGAVGTLGVSVSHALTGVQGTGSVGTLGTNVNKNVAITGVSGTGSVGSLGKSTVHALTGVSGTGSVGTLTPSTGFNVALTGVSGTGSVGNLGKSVSHAFTGISGTGSLGTLTPTTSGPVTLALTGIQARGFLGTLGIGGTVAIGGHFLPHHLTRKQIQAEQKRRRKERKEQEAAWHAKTADADTLAAEIRSHLLPSKTIAEVINKANAEVLTADLVDDDDDEAIELLLLA